MPAVIAIAQAGFSGGEPTALIVLPCIHFVAGRTGLNSCITFTRHSGSGEMEAGDTVYGPRERLGKASASLGSDTDHSL